MKRQTYYAQKKEKYSLSIIEQILVCCICLLPFIYTAWQIDFSWGSLLFYTLACAVVIGAVGAVFGG